MPKSFLKIGKISRPLGIKGAFKVQLYIDALDDLKEVDSFYIKRGEEYFPFEIKELSYTGKADVFLLKFESINDRTTADKYYHLDLYIDDAFLHSTKEDEVYIKDLLDLEVFVDGNLFGKIQNVFEIANVHMLEIKMEKDQKVLVIPYKDEYIENLDIKSKKINIKNYEDFL